MKFKIPERWQLYKLNSCVNILTSNVDKKNNKDEISVKLCNYNDVYRNEYISGKTTFMLATATRAEIDKFKLLENDVIITKDSEDPRDIAIPSLVTISIPELVCGYHLVILRPKKNMVLGSYLNKLLQLSYYRNYFYTLANGATRFGLTKDSIEKVKILLPPLKEQKKIAEILSTWDKAIGKLETLIELNKKRKKALQQQLLTGKKRFKEFEGVEWNTYLNKMLFKERKEIGFIDLPLVSVTINNGLVDREDIEKKDSSNSNKSKYLRILPGDIVYNTMRMWQGASGVAHKEGIVSPAYTVCVSNKKLIKENFAQCLFKLPKVVNLFYRFSQGLVSDTLNLKFNNFSKIKLNIPSITEQDKISSVFDIIEKEINTLKSKLEKIKQQKKGLMQQLLTGKKRVIIDE